MQQIAEQIASTNFSLRLLFLHNSSILLLQIMFEYSNLGLPISNETNDSNPLPKPMPIALPFSSKIIISFFIAQVSFLYVFLLILSSL